VYLLDTNVVSELRKAPRGLAHRSVVEWAAGVTASVLYLSVITIMELEQGVLMKERRDPAQGRVLRQWLTRQVVPAFSNRVLPIDIAIARRCAKLYVPDPRGERDAMIAATALVHGMTIVTRNEADFAPTGVALFNPWLL